MKFFVFILLFISFDTLSDQTRILPYKVKEDGKDYEIKENAGLNKYQRIGRNERAIQDLYQKIELLEKKLETLQNAKNNGQNSPK